MFPVKILWNSCEIFRISPGNLNPAQPVMGLSFVTFVMWPYRTKDRYISWKLVRTAASYLKNEFGVNFHSHVVIKYRLSWWKWAQLWKYSLQSLPNFWSGQLTKMLYHSSELGTFLLHLVLMEAEEIIILNIKKKIIGENHFSHYLPLQKSAFVCSLIEKSKLLRWRLVSQSRSLWLRFELFNIFPGPGWESRNCIFEGNKISFLNDNLFSFITRSALPLHAFFFKLPTLLFSVDMQIVETSLGPGTDWKYEYKVYQHQHAYHCLNIVCWSGLMLHFSLQSMFSQKNQDAKT